MPYHKRTLWSGYPLLRTQTVMPKKKKVPYWQQLLDEWYEGAEKELL